eukprot:TRINITY_DN28901_c0_g1_i1.p1 TRINITY_DN28901_c0_g1~~TRINITY_DN28901_c0_g1_i1.p1  ORF type:complete len:2003 (+),score=252.77 TRINITY_DN28901_c0_g1_i1:394-6009(+)
MPEGYVKLADGTWDCAEGFAGKATARCVPDESCQSSLQLFGCEVKEQCAPPAHLIGCLLDVSGCADVKPGGSCGVSCRFPYTGWSSVAVCHPDNTNPDVGLLVVEPECVLTCEDPPNEPGGYILDPDSENGWSCAPGYGGVAKTECVIDSVCASKKTFSGCSLLAPCILPEPNGDSCMYDFTDCVGENAQPGQSCWVHCKSPYIGNSTNASCGDGNTDSLQVIKWTPPDCSISCEEVADTPMGYLSHPYLRVRGGWRCVSGFAGNPRVTCGTDANCQPMLRFGGCKKLKQCRPLTLSRGEMCTFEGPLCALVGSGKTCQVSCKPPYVGGATTALCPPNNTFANRKLEYELPDCNLKCMVPDPMPDGYLTLGIDKAGEDTWACAPNHEGAPNVICGIRSNCEAAYVFSGCIPQTSCAIPQGAHCSVDWSDCQDVFAGESCQVVCGPSFEGNVTEASCPAANTDPSTPLDWVFPGCSLICLDPVGVPGYEKNAFMCAENYSGVVQSECTADHEKGCEISYQFSGCKPTVPCGPPRRGHERSKRQPGFSKQYDLDDLCMYDFSDCDAVEPGGSCIIKCGSGYEGRSTTAFCPVDNTEPEDSLIFVEPLCVLKACDEPPPPGYVLSEYCGWFCAEGYHGHAEAHCEPVGTIPGKCESKLFLSGCGEMKPCVPLEVNDTCRTNVSECLEVMPGDACNVSCWDPYVGGRGENATWAYCPDFNTDPDQVLIWGEPEEEWALDCHVNCHMPPASHLPVGYQYADGHVVCNRTANFVGTAEGNCLVNSSNCEPYMEFSGCWQTQPCLMPEVDHCEYDTSDCPESGFLFSGESCVVKCSKPYMTPINEPHGSMVCPVDNIAENAMVFTPPNCVLGCASVTFQEGYTNRFGPWRCDKGWKGPGAIWEDCVVDPDSCVVYPQLSGCLPFIPCVAPALTAKQVCTIDLVGGNCEAVLPGEQCQMFCKSPYYGQPIGAACPLENIDPTRVINWAPPDCHCPPPLPTPEGYVWLSPSIYECADGYLGRAVFECIINEETCEYKATLTGCDKIVPCAAPVPWNSEKKALEGAEKCTYNVVDCQKGFGNGEECNVTCGKGLEENITYVECPSDNTIPDYPPWFDLQCSDYQCLPRDEWSKRNKPPEGYQVGDWQCRKGYQGSVTTNCRLGDNCEGKLDFFGCIPEKGCLSPMISPPQKACRFNFTQCEELEPGDFCEVTCAAPFYGSPAKAFCTPGNIDPTTELTWAEPDCRLDCDDPDPIPPGYMKTSCGWQCQDGYEGRAVVDCDVDDQCKSRLKLSGCTREEDCAPPRKESYDTCRFDFADCENLGAIPPGFSCLAKCKAPYVGPDFFPVCPGDNTVPEGDLVWSGDRCIVTCPDPDPLPEGYLRNTEGEWICADGYLGLPVVNCIVNSTCGGPFMELRNCEKIVPCAAPELPDLCKLEALGCVDVNPGSTCEIACKAPAYSGNVSSVAICPSPNTIADRPLEWEEPICSLECPPKVIPKAYAEDENGVDVCSVHALGKADVKCLVHPNNCTTYWDFSGCDLLQPCQLPKLDACRIDPGDCADLSPGGLCVLSCTESFVGPEVNATCPEGNIDPTTEIILDGQLDCKCPFPEPEPGYEEAYWEGPFMEIDGGEWVCADNYAGTAVATCEVDAECNPLTTLSGCELIYHCAPPQETYMGHPSDCQKIEAGTTCEARCIAHECVTGGPLQFACPFENTDPTRKPDLIAGVCKVNCEICKATLFVDTDPRPGILTGKLRFGEAHANGRMPVTGIHGYHAYFTDDCGLFVGRTLGYVERSKIVYECCAATAYSIDLKEVKVPTAAVQMVVAVNTSFGELLYAAPVVWTDLTENLTTVAPRIITAGGPRACIYPCAWLLACVATFTCLTS